METFSLNVKKSRIQMSDKIDSRDEHTKCQYFTRSM